MVGTARSAPLPLPTLRIRFSNSHSFAISPPVLREVCSNVPPSEIRGRRECRALDAPAAARVVVVNTRVSHHGHTGTTRHSPRNGFNGFLRAPRRPGFLATVIGGLLRQLDTSVGVSGPHDFAVRLSAVRQ